MGMKRKSRQMIAEEMKALARAKRLASRAAWKGGQVVSAYVLWKREGFSGGRIARVLNSLEEHEAKYDELGQAYVEEVRKVVNDEKHDLKVSIDEVEVTLPGKVGSYEYFRNKKQMEFENEVNLVTDRFVLFLLKSLMENEKYGNKRLHRVEEGIVELYHLSNTEADLLDRLVSELEYGTGLVFDRCKDWKVD